MRWRIALPVRGRRRWPNALRRTTLFGAYTLLHLPIAGCEDETTAGDCSPSPVRGSWSDLPSLIAARTRHTATALANGDIVVAGGRTCADEPADLATVERYTAGADRWIALAPLPAPRSGHAAIALGEDLLVLGGTTNGAPALDVVRHDAAVDAWTVVSTLPIEARVPLVALLDDGSVVITDGSAPGDRNDWFRSSDGAQTWVRIADGPAIGPSNGGPGPHAALVPIAAGRLVVVQTWGVLGTYDSATDAWTQDAASPHTWIGAAARFGDGSVLLVEGVPTTEQEPVGTTQYEPVGLRLVPSSEQRERIGFAGCPHTTGKLEQYEAMAWGAETNSVVVTMAGTLSVYDRDVGWADLPPDPNGSTGWTGLLLRDGSFLAVGGCGAAEDVRRWSP